MGGRDRDETRDENEDASCRGQECGQARILFEPERWRGIEPSDGLVGDENEEGGKAHDAGKEKRDKEEDETESVIERERDGTLYEWPGGVGEGVDSGVVMVIHDDGCEPRVFNGDEENDEREEIEEIDPDNALRKNVGQGSTEEQETTVIDELWQAGIVPESEEIAGETTIGEDEREAAHKKGVDQ